MRRFIVLFLLLVLPLQVLAASIDDLNAVYRHASHASADCVDPGLGHSGINSAQAPISSEPGNQNQPSVHADLNDSVDIADAHCPEQNPSILSRSCYIDTIIADVFLAIITPPVI